MPLLRLREFPRNHLFWVVLFKGGKTIFVWLMIAPRKPTQLLTKKNKFRPRYFHFLDAPFAYFEEKNPFFTRNFSCALAPRFLLGVDRTYIFRNPNRVGFSEIFLEPNRTQFFWTQTDRTEPTIYKKSKQNIWRKSQHLFSYKFCNFSQFFSSTQNLLIEKKPKKNIKKPQIFLSKKVKTPVIKLETQPNLENVRQTFEPMSPSLGSIPILLLLYPVCTAGT